MHTISICRSVATSCVSIPFDKADSFADMLNSLSYDVTSESETTPLVVYRFTGTVMTSITTLRT